MRGKLEFLKKYPLWWGINRYLSENEVKCGDSEFQCLTSESFFVVLVSSKRNYWSFLVFCV